MIMLFLAPIATADDTGNTSSPELETYILTGVDTWLIKIHVRNTGDATAHNVTLTELNIVGPVIFNFQTSMMGAGDLEPGEMTILDTNSLLIGFGGFTISMTVSCDEGVSSTSSATGLIFGPLIFIP